MTAESARTSNAVATSAAASTASSQLLMLNRDFQLPQNYLSSSMSSSMITTSEIPTTISSSTSYGEIRLQTPVSTHDNNTSTPTATTTAASTKLGERLFGDVLVATTVTAGVAPFLTVVDKAIVESAAGTKTLWRSGLDSVKSVVHNPLGYVKSPTFLLMWAVYAATYSTANSFKTLEEHARYHHEKQQQRQHKRHDGNHASSSNGGRIGQFGQIGIFLGTTVVNSGTSMMKDRAYAQMFGASNSSVTTVQFPKASYVFWALRDLSVIGSSFMLPDLVATKLSADYGMEKDRTLSYCQLTLPVLAQLIAGPFHFLGLDVYNRNLDHLPNRTMVLKDRLSKLSQGIWPVIMARMARIAPGYGIGGVYNTKFRTAWRDFLLERHVKGMMKDAAATSSPTATVNSPGAKSTGLVALLYGMASSSSR